MPTISNNDRFFSSNYNFQVLLDWIQEVRNELLALNTYTPGNSQSVINTEQLKIFSANAIKSFGYYSLSRYEKQQIDLKIKSGSSLNKKVSDQIVLDSKDSIRTQNVVIGSIQKDNQTRTENLTDSVNQEALFLTSNSENPYQYGVTGSDQVLAGNGGFDDVLFPELNKPYDNNMASITERVNNTFEYDVKTGNLISKKEEKLFKSWAKIGADQKMSIDQGKTFSPQRPQSEVLNEILKKYEKAQFPGSYKFFIEKLHGRYSNGKPYKKNKIQSTKNKKEIPIELTNRMLFSAYINNYNDNYDLDSTKYNLLGRSEPFPIYKTTTRKFTLEFLILADYSAQLLAAMSRYYEQSNKQFSHDQQLDSIINTFPDWGLGEIREPQIIDQNRVGGHIPGMYSDTTESLWHKITFLSQCVYPYYRTDGKMKEQPFVRIRVGDFYDVIGMISNLSFDLNVFDDGIMVDLNPSTSGNLPLGIKVTMSVDIYHDNEPNSNFWGFYHRKEFDTGDMDPVTGANISKNKLDETKENSQKNSPLEIFNKIKNEKLLDTPDILRENFDKLKKTYLDFTNNFDKLKKTGIKIKEEELKKRTKNTIKSFEALQKVVDAIKTGEGDFSVSGVDPKKTNELFPRTSPDVDPSLLQGKVSKKKTSLSDKINNTKQDLTNLKENFTNLYGEAQAHVNKVANTVNKVNQNLKKVGINLDKNNSLETISNKVNDIKPQIFIPKTLGEILDKVKSKKT